MNRIALTLTAGVLATPAAAEIGTTRLYEAEPWIVEYQVDEGRGYMACLMIRYSPDAILSFRMERHDASTGFMSLHVMDLSWNAAPRKVPIYVDIDDRRFSRVAHVDGSSLFAGSIGAELMLAVAGGNAIAISNAEGQRLLSYSLRGSSAAAGALVDCWKKFGGSDPF